MCINIVLVIKCKCVNVILLQVSFKSGKSVFCQLVETWNDIVDVVGFKNVNRAHLKTS